MARIRSIKPEFFASEQVASVSSQWRLLFIGLWLHADREGRLLDRPVRLKAMLFPYDDLDVDEGLGCLVNAGLITRYEGNGLRLISIPTWAKHQLPHIREADSVLPPPDDQKSSASTVLALREGKGADQEGKGTSLDALRARFDAFWSVYPRKQGKEAAWKEWLKRKPNEALAHTMIEKVQEQRQTPQWMKDSGQFIPQPRTWLSQGRWEDEVASGPREVPARWSCPHVDHCSHRGECESKTTIGPERYPVKAAS